MHERWSTINTLLAGRGISTSLTRWRSEVILRGTTRLDLSCYNSILFLLQTENLPVGTRLYSDVNMYEFTSDPKTETYEEFSGLVTITLPEPATKDIRIDFLQIHRK